MQANLSVTTLEPLNLSFETLHMHLELLHEDLGQILFL